MSNLADSGVTGIDGASRRLQDHRGTPRQRTTYLPFEPGVALVASIQPGAWLPIGTALGAAACTHAGLPAMAFGLVLGTLYLAISQQLHQARQYCSQAFLASNFHANIDDAFQRRFNAIIRFPFPSEVERREIWTRTLPEQDDRERLASLLARFELSGGNIVNVVQFAAIEAIAAGRPSIRLGDAVTGVQRELEKEGKVFRNLVEEASE